MGTGVSNEAMENAHRVFVFSAQWTAGPSAFFDIPLLFLILVLIGGLGSAAGPIVSVFLKNVQWKWGQNAMLATGKSFPLSD